jgi:copper chaperone
METETFVVKNVKCGGCASAIQNGLMPMPGVHEVEVAVEGGRVTVRGESLTRQALSAKLSELGYPEA